MARAKLGTKDRVAISLQNVHTNEIRTVVDEKSRKVITIRTGGGRRSRRRKGQQ